MASTIDLTDESVWVVRMAVKKLSSIHKKKRDNEDRDDECRKDSAL
jgi:hypothetical protein